jgi:thioredoxin 1
MSKEISTDIFSRKVIDNPGLSIVRFYKSWNGACQIIAPIFDELSVSYKGQASFYSVDVEANKDLATGYGIMDVPTILFFRMGMVIDHSTGLTPKNILIHKIEKALSTLN